jgi:hypothetical protein
MNVAGAGPLVACALEWREGRGDALAGRAGRYLAGVSLLLFLVGMVLGLAYGWAKWTPEYRRAIELLGSRIDYGVWELAFSVALMMAHWIWWRSTHTLPGWLRVMRGFLPLLSSTNTLYHFPFLFAILAQVAAGENEGMRTLTSAEFRGRMADGLVLARVTHFWLASLAVTGIVFIGYSLRLTRSGAPAADTTRVAVWGGRLALVPTLLQIPVGLWLLSQLPAEGQNFVTGGDLIGTCLFAASVLTAVWLMHQLAVVALGDARKWKLIGSMVALVVVATLMTGTLLRLEAAGARPPRDEPGRIIANE